MPEEANEDWRCVYALFSVNVPGDFGRDGKWVKGRVENSLPYFACENDRKSNFCHDDQNFGRKL